MNSNYLSIPAASKNNRAPKTMQKSRKGAFVFLAVIFSLLFSSFSAMGMATAQSSTVYADDESQAIWEKVICWFPEDSTIRTAYQLFSTSDLWFYLYSKSTIGINGSDYDEGFNTILDFVNSEGGKLPAETLKARNEKIFGLTSTEDDPDPIGDNTEPEDPSKFNKGEKISFYDRFGIAGLNFSSYSGEWRHYWIDACEGTKFDGYAPQTTITSSGSITLVNANARDERTLKANIANIQAATPSGSADIFALQEQGGNNALLEEALPGYTITRTKAKVISTSETLDEVDNAPNGNDGGSGFLVIASKDETVGAPVASGSVLIKKPSVHENYRGVKKNWPRIAFWTTYSSGLTVINAHLQICNNFQTCGANPERRRTNENLLALANEKASGGPVIITGDFNDGNDSKAINTKLFKQAGFLKDDGADAHPKHTYYSSSSIQVSDSGNISRAAINRGISGCGPTECYDHRQGAGWGTYEMAGNGTSSTVVGTLNILGSGHTDCNHSKDKCNWPDSATRTPKMLDALESEGVSLVALQEVHGPQVRQINRANDGSWGLFPGNNSSQNQILYKKSAWKLVDEGEDLSFKIHYHRGHDKQRTATQAVGLFEHASSGQRVYMMSIHNTINKNGANWQTRMTNLEDEITVVNGLVNSGYPIIMAGDFNDGANKTPASEVANSWCVIPPLLNHSFGAAPNCAANPGQKPPGSANLDHIYGGNGLAFESSKVNKSVMNQKIADHPLVSSTVVIGGSDTPSALVSGLPTGGHGQFYKERLIPRSTWGDINKSADPRTKQFSNGIGARVLSALMTNVTNWGFTLSKMIVVLTIAIIGLAFADVAGMLGITSLVVGEQYSESLFEESGAGVIHGNSTDGIVGVLYTSLFGNLVILAFVMTGVWVFWNGIVKRQYRNAMGGLIKTIACFIMGVIIFSYPKLFITIPNDVAVVGQVFTASALNMDSEGQSDAVCTTDAGRARPAIPGKASVRTAEQSYGILERASVEFRSVVGCHLWKSLLLRPWVEGQYHEKDYKTLNGRALVLAKDGGVANRNTNYQPEIDEASGWAGRPEVPRGGGKFYENWALFQISTQTNIHIPYGYEADQKRAEYTQEVATDWWRVVDVFSNYQESLDDGTRLQAGERKTVAFSEPLPTKVMPQWNTWVGNDPGYRTGIVLSSVLIASIVAIAPLFFSMLAVMYSIGLAILMMVSPIFFLLGCWAGRGFEIFKAWADMVVNLVIKRIMLGILLIFTLKLTTAMLEQMERYGYWQTILLTILLTVVLIMSKEKILGAVAGFKSSSIDLSSTASRVAEKSKSSIGTTARVGTSLAAGGIKTKAHGGSFTKGLMTGAKEELKSASYRADGAVGQVLRNARTAHDSAKGFAGVECGFCGRNLNDDGYSGQISEHSLYGYIHYECGLELDDPEGMLGEFVGVAKSNDEIERQEKRKQSVLEETDELKKFEIVLKTDNEEEKIEDVQAAIDALVDLAVKSKEEIIEYNKNKATAIKDLPGGRITPDKLKEKRVVGRVVTPTAPSVLGKSIDNRGYRQAVVENNVNAAAFLVLEAGVKELKEKRSDLNITDDMILDAQNKVDAQLSQR